MLRLLGRIIIVVGILTAISQANSDRYIIVIDKNQTIAEKLAGFPGRCWAKTENKIYLGGGTSELAWLTNQGISHNQIEFDEENTPLYLCYINYKNAIIAPNIVIDEGPNFVLATEPIKQAQFCRRLSLRKLPFVENEMPADIILTYNAQIDSLIDQVSQDTLIEHLSRLSGQLPVTIGGQLDTIRTRYSGTADIGVAAAYIKQLLESYGYQTEYHGYYGGSLRHVAVYDANRAWTVAESGEALKTTDGGNTWSVMATGVSTAMWGVTHIGPDSVWVTGNSGVIRFSSNGGSSFTGQSAATGGYLFGSSFINSIQGWVAADSGLVYRTTNAGVNWTRYSTPVTSRYYDVCFVDSLYGWAIGRNGVIVRSTNSGITWVRQTSNTTERLYGVDFIDRNNGWVVGWGGVVLHTTNGGTNWQTVNLGTAVEKMYVDFTDSLHGCITGYSGEVFVTSNGGSSWQSINTGFSKDFYGVEFVDSLTGYAVGTGIIAKSSDGGHTWQNQCGTIESAWKNIIATKPGEVNQNQQVIVCGHYDNTSQTPSVLATGADDNGSGTIGVIAAMYHSGRDPLHKVSYKSAKVFSARSIAQRRLHKAFLRYHDEANFEVLREALITMNRRDLIGDGEHQLVPAASLKLPKRTPGGRGVGAPPKRGKYNPARGGQWN